MSDFFLILDKVISHLEYNAATKVISTQAESKAGRLVIDERVALLYRWPSFYKVDLFILPGFSGRPNLQHIVSVNCVCGSK